MTNPPIAPERTIEANLQVPAPVSKMLRSACGNCHSNLTNWPWYAHVAPFSWAVAGDVNEARSVLNFSEWASGPGASPELSISWLTMICADVQAGRMPLRRYLLLHPESRLTAREMEGLCGWTRTEIARLETLSQRENAGLRKSPRPAQ